MRKSALVAVLLVGCIGCAAKGSFTQETFFAPSYEIVIPARWGVSRTLPTLSVVPGFQRPDEEFNYRMYSIPGASPTEMIRMTLSWTANAVYNGGRNESPEQEFRQFIDDAILAWEGHGWTDVSRAPLPKVDPCCVGQVATGTGTLLGSSSRYRFIKIAVLRHDGLATAEIGGPLPGLLAQNVDALVGDLVVAMTSAKK